MSLKELTTSKLLALENSGGVLTSGTVPNELSLYQTVYDWIEAMPLVDRRLVVDWHCFCEQKEKLENTITKLEAYHE